MSKLLAAFNTATLEEQQQFITQVAEQKQTPVVFNRFNPVIFEGLGSGWERLEAEEDGEATKITALDPTKVVCEIGFLGGRFSLRGEDKLAWHRNEKKTCLNADHFLFLWENKHLIPLEWKKFNAVYFDGSVLRASRGARYVLCLYWHDGAWGWNTLWLGHVWNARRPSLVLAH